MSSPDRSIAPPVADLSDIHLCERQSERLENGVELSIVNSGEQALWRLSLVWDGGSLDTPKRSLPMLMLENMCEQSEMYTGAQIADIIDFNGARMTSRCSDHYSILEIIALNSKIPTLLPMLHEIICRPKFEAPIVEMVARKAAARRAMLEAKVPYAASIRTMQAIAGENHPSATYESPEVIKQITPDELANTYADIIENGHLHAYLAGKLSNEDIELVRDFLKKLPERKGNSIINTLPYSPQNAGKFFVERAESRQSAISMAMPAIKRSHPDYIDLRLTVMALGGYFSSRLMSNIREEKGLTYGISGALMGSHEGSYVSIDAQCDAAYVEQVIEETCKEIIDLQNNPPQGEELRRVKRHAWTALANTADSPFATADHYITNQIIGCPDDYFAQQQEAVAKLSSERIAELAKQYLNPEELRISVAGIKLS